MPERVLIVAASPHRAGTTAAVAALIAGGAADAGFRPLTRSLAEGTYRGCVHCGACRRPPHACALAGGDDTESLLEAMARADIVFWVSPVYFYGLPAQAKAVVDRAQSRWEALRGGAAEPALPEGSGADAGTGRRTAAVLLAGQREGRLLFEGSRLTLRYFFETLGRDAPARRELRGLDSAADIGAGLARDVRRWAADFADLAARSR